MNIQKESHLLQQRKPNNNDNNKNIVALNVRASLNCVERYSPRVSGSCSSLSVSCSSLHIGGLAATPNEMCLKNSSTIFARTEMDVFFISQRFKKRLRTCDLYWRESTGSIFFCLSFYSDIAFHSSIEFLVITKETNLISVSSGRLATIRCMRKPLEINERF